MTNLTSKTIHGYELQEEIGAGGFGAVYRAYQPLLKREVAIKVILPQYANSPDFIRRFEIEAELVARLEFPHIVPLYDYWREVDGAYIVMRLLRGGTLEDAINESRLSLEQTATVLDQITAALHVAHRNGVVHRDIKPGNILMDEDGNAYLTDFGIALSADYESMANDEGISGSIAYTPPEQLQGGQITPQTDIYSLGIVLYQMVTGEHPYGEATVSELIFKQISDPIPDFESDDLPVEINDIIQKATSKDPEDRYDDVREMATEFRQALLGETAFVAFESEPTFVDLPNPYKGLRAFQEADADQFFGRESLVERLLDRLNEPVDGARFLAVIGPSGSGKSSVVKAGLLPALRRGEIRGSENWFVVEMFPSISPFTELEAALKRVAVNPIDGLLQQVTETQGLSRVIEQILPEDGSELLLVIDQFEELFTQVEDESIRTAFLDNLLESVQAPDSRLRVIVTMRADFYDRPLQYRDFGELLRKRIETVLPMSPNELHDTITKPAELVGVSFQPGLVDAISRDVGEQSGMLPLLQYTMTELFDQREGLTLTLASYQNIGGVAGSLARRSEEIYNGLGDKDKQAVRQLFLRLVSLGDGAEDTRRRVRQSELATSDAMDNVIQLYGRYRLLTFDKDPASREPTVEVAHEALIRTWQRLRDWIAESYEDLRIQQRVSAAVAEWLSSGKDAGFLASGARLTQFDEWRNQTQLILNDDEQNYITSSINAETARKDKELAIARRVQNFQRASIVLAAMVILAIGATGIFLSRANQAQQRVNESNETLTPAQATVVQAQTQAQDAQDAVVVAQVEVNTAQAGVDSAQADVGTAQAEVNAIGATLTPIQATVIAGDAQLATNQSDLVMAQDLADSAQTDVASANETLAPIPTILAQSANQVNDSSTQIANANETLAPIPTILTQSANQVNDSSTQIANANETLAPIPTILTESANEVNNAGTQAANANETLIPLPPTLTQSANQINDSSTQIANANGILEAIPPTLTQAANQINVAVAQVDDANATLVNLPPTLTQSANQVNDASTQVANANETLVPIPTILTEAANQINEAQLQLIEIQETTIPATLGAISTEVQVAQNFANSISLAAQGLDIFQNQRNQPLGLRLAYEAVVLNDSSQSQRILGNIAYAPNANRTFFDQGGATQAILSPDGTQILYGDWNRTVNLLNMGSNRVARQFRGLDATIRAVAMSPDGSQVAAASEDHIIILWDVETGDIIHSLEGHIGFINDLQFSPNGSQLVSVSGDNSGNAQVLMWDTATGAMLRQFDGHTQGVYSAAFSPDGSQLATGSSFGELMLWDVASGQATRLISNQLGWFVKVAFSPDGTQVVTGDWNADVILWDIATYEQIRRFQGHVDLVRGVDFSSDGSRIASGGDDKTVIIWNAETGEIIERLGHGTNVRSVEFTPDGTQVATLGDQRFYIWDVIRGDLIRQYSHNASEVTSVAFSPDGQFMISAHNAVSGANGYMEARLLLWDTATNEIVREFVGHSYTINSIAFTPDGSQILTGGGPLWTEVQELILWDVTTGEIVRRLDGPTMSVQSVTFSPDGTLFATGGGRFETPELFIWDFASGEIIHRLIPSEQFPNPIDDVVFSPDGQTLYASSYIITEWNVTTGEKIRDIVPTSVEGGRNLVISPDGRYLATGTSNSAEVLLYDIAVGIVVQRFVGHTDYVDVIAFSPDGSRIVSGAWDDTVITWDVATGSLVQQFTGHTDDITAVTFSNDGTYIVSTSLDTTLRLWRNDNLSQMLDWIRNNRFMPELSCEQRVLYGAEPCGT